MRIFVYFDCKKTHYAFDDDVVKITVFQHAHFIIVIEVKFTLICKLIMTLIYSTHSHLIISASLQERITGIPKA